MMPYFHGLLIQSHGMISALMIYGHLDKFGVGRTGIVDKVKRC